MRVIAIVNQKGGCGKTTTTTSLAGCLVADGARVLVVDMDPQAHATLALGVDPELAQCSRQLLAAQYRIENIGKRRIRPSQLVRKAYFDEALFLFEHSRPRSRENRSILKRWKEQQQGIRQKGEAPDAGPTERPSRRRSSRGRRR